MTNHLHNLTPDHKHRLGRLILDELKKTTDTPQVKADRHLRDLKPVELVERLADLVEETR